MPIVVVGVADVWYTGIDLRFGVDAAWRCAVIEATLAFGRLVFGGGGQAWSASSGC